MEVKIMNNMDNNKCMRKKQKNLQYLKVIA